MNQKLGKEKSLSHNENDQEIDQKELDNEKKKICLNCFGEIKEKDAKHFKNQINQINQKKQSIQQDRSNQLKIKLDNLNNLNGLVEQLRNFYAEQMEQIVFSIKNWSQQLIDEDEVFIKNLQQNEYSDYSQFMQYIRKEQDAQIKNQTDQIKKINHLILNLKETDLVKQCLIFLESQNINPILLKINNGKENKIIDEELNLICEEHKKQITLFDLSAKKLNNQKRIGCLDCLDGTINQYTSIKRAQNMWQQIQQQKLEKMNQHVEILKIKIKSIKEYFLAMQKSLNNSIENATIKITLYQEDYILKVRQTNIQLMNTCWQYLNKKQLIEIAQELSQINQLSIQEDPLMDEYCIQENFVYEIAKDTIKSLQECQITYSDQISHLINNQIITYHQESSNKQIESQSTDIIDQQKIKSTILENKEQEQQLSINLKQEQQQIIDKQQPTQSILSQKQQKVLQPFKFNLIENSSIQQNEFCRAIAFNQDCTIVLAGCNNLIKVFEFKQEQLKFTQLLSEHQKDVHVLDFMKKTINFISGSADKQIIIWQINQNKEWECQQKLNGHTHYIRCMILNNKENMIISGSPDKTIKFWIKRNEWQCEQTITDHMSWISGLSLNDQQNKLISSGGDKLILIMEQSKKEDKWIVIQKIIVEQYGDRICFINDDLFTFQPYSEESMHIYKLKNNNQYLKSKEIAVKGGSSGDSYLFPQKYIKNKCLLLNKNGNNINLIRQKENGDFIIEQSIDFETYYLFGQISEDGEYLITWDNKSTQIQLRKYHEQ
ncbi:unnamed protein product [Paramecium sonneborni]|uniref:WD40-repeat-containing domain n=1 Tax=Paramecium sonneborni TaxID=65129 RepID=A0A8S1RT52_9CILI|nr:unnamed protein product [Paramecium sonneborni]